MLSARSRASHAAAAIAVLGICGVTIAGQSAGSRSGAAAAAPAHRSTAAADAAWQRGDYVAALNAYIQILSAPAGDRQLASIARTTGELYQTHELTADGRAPRFSPDGAFIVYETGLEVSRRTKIFKNDSTRAEIADLPGISATFSHPLNRVAYLKIPDADDIRRASADLAAASLTAQNRAQLVQMLTWLIAKHAAIVVRDLESGREMELPTPDLLKSGLTFSADGRQLYFLGASENDPDRTDIYAISELAPKPVLVADIGGLKSPPIVDPAGKVMMFVVPPSNPFRRPASGRSGGRGGTGPQGQAGQARRAGEGGEETRPPQLPAAFVVVDLGSHHVSTIVGTAPALSGDGRTLAYIARANDRYSLMLGPTTGEQHAVKETRHRIDAPALSDDGSRVAFQEMVEDDWEIFVADRDGGNERRVTREIQHDVLPRFVSRDRLLAMKGEPRDRRSYLYDLIATRSPSDRDPMAIRSLSDRDPMATRSPSGRDPVAIFAGRGTRLFHNNTIRTIAPEYQWAPSPDGTQILIGAERDGDTVSPERGVYLVDLTRTVTKAAVLDRLRANLRSETALRAAATHAFAPLADAVRQIVARVSVPRILSYETALSDFGSKNISKAGNRQASQFLFDTYTSFGYAPEYQWIEPSGRAVSGGKTANVVATLRGTLNPDLVYVVSSHYDSVEAGPGADDDSSGTAALLEAARVLAGHPLPATVVFASFTGEEAGLLGSREFVRRALADKLHVAAALNNDMIGWTADGRLRNTIRYANVGIRDIQHAAAMLFTRLITYDARYFKGTDAASLYDGYGGVIGGVGSYPVLASPHYHQASDRLEFENHQLIAETAKTTIASVMRLASSPSRITQLRIDDTRAPSNVTVTWARSPEKDVTSYVVAYGPSSNPLRRRMIVAAPRATLAQIAPGTVVSVKAVDARGLDGWDWARITIGESASRMTP